ncbi:hypothetical protein MCUN1_001490 [Malassezia cuniculi]|uniref:Magnesium transporter NIPA2 n=1 Tax=Malassezia cuniculi TaxID=948313 RepID=A0AAF0J6K0_9BASI|nr:hypothetical protein MCUN1_001490 [Malassezia cuniculi]
MSTETLTQDKWIGFMLALSSSAAIGTSFIITKKGLISSAGENGLASDRLAYLQNPIWWAGMATMVVGEVANFVAYMFAPPILVTPLGALSVLIGAILASFILKERLGKLGKLGCALCLAGTVVVIVNAPGERNIQTVDEILALATRPPFVFYCVAVTVFSIYMIVRVVPVYGRQNPLVYLSICSLVGSISVMSIKGFGVALKLTFSGNNQLTHISTYLFAIVVVLCIAIQMNYFNRALDLFSTNVVNPIYYVTFTTSTIVASVLLFGGFDTSFSAAVSLLGGFFSTFVGVYLLNLNQQDTQNSEQRTSYTRLGDNEELRDSFEMHVPDERPAFVLDDAHRMPSTYTPWESLLFSVALLTVLYNVRQLIPTNWLPFVQGDNVGYHGDLFLALNARVMVPTQTIREAFSEGGALSDVLPYSRWPSQYGASLDHFFTRLTSTAGRRLYLVTGALPFLACSFCVTETDYRVYAALGVSYIYVVHLLVIALLTDPPRGPFARLVNWLWTASPTGVPNSPPIIPARSREFWRGPVSFGLLIMWGADLFVIFSGDRLSMVGRRAHWHANAHLARHALLTLIVLVTYFVVRTSLPKLLTARMVGAIQKSAAAIEQLEENLTADRSGARRAMAQAAR